MKNLNLKQYLEFMEDDMLIACRKMQRSLYNEEMNEEDAVDLIKNSSNSKQMKIAVKITKDVIPHIFKQTRRLTYHLLSPPEFSSSPLMMPNYVLFVEPYSSITFELCFVEVKRKGNHYKGNYESDLVKMGKEMQISINKLILQKVTNPEVVGLLIKEDHVATAFKIDLKYNDQYRMMKISEFNFIRTTSDDILLLPTIMEKLNQIKAIISNTLKNLYEALGNKEDQEDLTSYIRTPCTCPVHTKISQ
ncbi:hypothetical protein BD408DRAFT_477957 [Parasitella parasitica]|nr:hypothetical protein BD408DRAFT_477957 [Parasitella parasitica]